MGNAGKAGDKALIISRSLSDSGLLEDYFREPDEIWVPGFSPRQVTGIDSEPVDYLSRNWVHPIKELIKSEAQNSEFELKNFKIKKLPLLLRSENFDF
jgi:hypothetical protein